LLDASAQESEDSDFDTGNESESLEMEDDGGEEAEYVNETGDELEYEHDAGDEWESTADQDGLAYELMTVSDPAEMEEFLGKLMSAASRRFKKFGANALPKLLPVLKGPVRGLLKRAMPLLGSAAGSVVPGAGTLLGGMAGQKLGQLLGGEMEGASDDEAKVELSRKLVNTVTDAVDRAAQDPAARSEPIAAARDALVGAMQANLPSGVRQAMGQRSRGSRASSGRWIRRGRQIILLGV
jgi:hypothetical protein